MEFLLCIWGVQSTRTNMSYSLGLRVLHQRVLLACPVQLLQLS